MDDIKLQPGEVYLDMRASPPKRIQLGSAVGYERDPSFQPKGFKIEVGKSYRTRDGSTVVKIVGLDDPHGPLYRPTHPYLGDDDEAYTETGVFNGVHCTAPVSEYDLVEEVSI